MNLAKFSLKFEADLIHQSSKILLVVTSGFLTDTYLYIHTKYIFKLQHYCLDGCFQSLRIGGLDPNINFAQVVKQKFWRY